MAPADAPHSDPPLVVSLVHAGLGHGPRRDVLRDAHVDAHAGHRVLIVGANGSGKSTLLATLAGLLPPRSGQVRVHGLDPLTQRRQVHRQTGHLGHTDPFYPELTGHENLLLHARLRGLGPDEVARRLDEAGLNADAHRLLGEYSHGMKRRLGLVKALLGDPPLLLLDEPDSGLDRQAHTRLGEQLGAQGDTTVLMATHTPQAHLEWATHAWVLGSRRLNQIPGDDKGVSRAALDRALEEVAQ